MGVYSENDEERIILSYFENKKDGIVLESGARDGILDSNSFYLIKNLNWKGILVEADPRQFSLLETNYKNLKEKHILLNKALYSQKGLQFILHQADSFGWSNQAGHTTIDDSFKLRAENLSNVIYNNSVIVETTTITDILKENNINKIDYISIDCEGSDFEVIKGIDFSLIDVRLISFEPAQNSEKIEELLKNNNFSFYDKTKNNVFYYKEK